jgi:hypothetical protein
VRCPPRAEGYAVRHIDDANGQRGMIVGRILGWIFLVAGFAVLVRDFTISFAERHWAPIALGQLWYDLDRTSLYITQSVVQRYVSRVLWDTAFATLLMCWASVALIVIGLALLIAFRPPATAAE